MWGISFLQSFSRYSMQGLEVLLSSFYSFDATSKYSFIRFELFLRFNPPLAPNYLETLDLAKHIEASKFSYYVKSWNKEYEASKAEFYQRERLEVHRKANHPGRNHKVFCYPTPENPPRSSSHNDYSFCD